MHEAAGGDAGEHPVHHRPRQRVAAGEELIGRKLKLAPVIDATHARAADRHPPATERHRPILIAVTLAGPVRVVLALRARKRLHPQFHQLLHQAQPGADTQRQQPLTRCRDQLAQPLLNLHGQRPPALLRGSDDLPAGYLLHGGSSCPLGLG